MASTGGLYSLAEAQVGVTRTGVPCLFGHRIKLSATAPASALAATADEFDRPTTQVVAVAVRPVQDSSAAEVGGPPGRIGWSLLRGAGRTLLANDQEAPVRRAQAARATTPERPIPAGDHQRRRGLAKVMRAVFASDLYPGRVGW
jgi:hypothetical protein